MTDRKESGQIFKLYHIRLRKLEDDFEFYSQIYQASAQQRRTSLGASEQTKLDQEIRNIDEEMEKLANQIDKLKTNLSKSDDIVRSENDEKEFLKLIEESEAELDEIARDLSPYKGLEAFTQNDKDLFFGRKEACADLLGKILGSTYVTVTGSSGSGKSSLMFAGVIPQLQEDGWIVAAMRPRTHPIRELALAFKTAVPEAVERCGNNAGLIKQIEDDTNGLHRLLEIVQEKPSQQKILLYIDQFEELIVNSFLQASQLDNNDGGDRRRAKLFLENLMQASKRGLKIVISLRSEFFTQLGQIHSELGPIFQAHIFPIRPILPVGLRDAIVEPARKYGVEIDNSVVMEIVNAVKDQDGKLPLLAFTMLKLWNNRSAGKDRITESDYQEIGGIEGALSQHAESVFESLAPEQKLRAERVLIRLISLPRADIRTADNMPTYFKRVMSQSEAPEDWDIIDVFAKSRLVVTHSKEAEDRTLVTAELVHDALIENWPRLEQMAGAKDRFVRWRDNDLYPKFDRWLIKEKSKSLLLSNEELASGKPHLDDNASRELLNSEEMDFITQSKNKQKWNRIYRLAFIATTIMLIMGLGIAVAVALSNRELRQQADDARVEAEEARYDAETARDELATRVVEEGFAKVTAVAASNLAATREAEAIIAEDVALRARATAEADRQFADQQSRLAESRAVAAVALRYAILDPNLCFHLALHAISITRDLDDIVTSEAENALHQCVQSAHSQFTITAHTLWVNGLALSPDGTLLATAGHDQRAKIWDLTTGEELAVTVLFNGPVHDVAFSPDGNQIAAASLDWTIRVWNLERTAQGLELSQGVRLTNPPQGSVNAVVYSPNGELMATAGQDGEIMLWDMTQSTPTQVATLIGHSHLINSLAFSEDGQRLLSAGADRTAIVWDVVQETALMILEGHTAAVTDVAFGANGKVATVSLDGTGRIWDISTGTHINLVGHEGRVNAVTFSPDGLSVATAGADGTIRLWDSTSGQLVTIYSGHTGSVTDLLFTADGLRLISSSVDRTVRVWDRYETLRLEGDKAQLNQDGARLLTSRFDSEAVLWDMHTGQEFLTIGDVDSQIFHIAYSAANNRIAIAYENGIISVWDGDSMSRITQIAPPNAPIAAIAFSPDGDKLFTANKSQPFANAELLAWSSEDGQLLYTLTTLPADVNALSVDHRGEVLSIALADGSVQLWDLQDRRQLALLEADKTSAYQTAFSPDDRMLGVAYVDGTAILWNLDTQEPKLTLHGHTGVIQSINFDASGTRVVTGGFDRIVRTWSVDTGKRLLELPVPGGAINNAMFTPDDSRLLLATSSGDIQIVILDLDELIAFAQERVTRSMTEQECRDLLQLEACP